jgi:hypothetical protein
VARAGGRLTDVWPLDAGLLGRFRAAGASIAWRASPDRRRRGSARIAHLNDEEARVEEDRSGGARTVRVDSGPVGALVLLLEFDRAGLPSSLRAIDAGGRVGFPQGAIEARWGGAAPAGPALPWADLVELARYALA